MPGKNTCATGDLFVTSAIPNTLWLCRGGFLWQGITQPWLKSAFGISERSVVARAVGMSFKLV